MGSYDGFGGFMGNFYGQLGMHEGLTAANQNIGAQNQQRLKTLFDLADMNNQLAQQDQSQDNWTAQFEEGRRRSDQSQANWDQQFGEGVRRADMQDDRSIRQLGLQLGMQGIDAGDYFPELAPKTQPGQLDVFAQSPFGQLAQRVKEKAVVGQQHQDLRDALAAVHGGVPPGLLQSMGFNLDDKQLGALDMIARENHAKAMMAGRRQTKPGDTAKIQALADTVLGGGEDSIDAAAQMEGDYGIPAPGVGTAGPKRGVLSRMLNAGMATAKTVGYPLAWAGNAMGISDTPSADIYQALTGYAPEEIQKRRAQLQAEMEQHKKYLGSGAPRTKVMQERIDALAKESAGIDSELRSGFGNLAYLHPENWPRGIANAMTRGGLNPF